MSDTLEIAVIRHKVMNTHTPLMSIWCSQTLQGGFDEDRITSSQDDIHPQITTTTG